MTTDSERGDCEVAAQAQRESTKELVRIFTRVLRRLGETGHVDEASRFAGRAWSTVRHTDPDAAAHINGIMHYLARLPDPVDTPRSDRSLRALPDPQPSAHDEAREHDGEHESRGPTTPVRAFDD